MFNTITNETKYFGNCHCNNGYVIERICQSARNQGAKEFCEQSCKSIRKQRINEVAGSLEENGRIGG